MSLWQPHPEQIEESLLTKFQQEIETSEQCKFSTYEEFHKWSIRHSQKFWKAVWDYCRIIGDLNNSSIVENYEDIKKCVFFQDAHLNFAENLLRRRDQETAIIFWGEDQVKRSFTFQEMYENVSQYRQILQDFGISKGDRVAAYVPNIPETLFAMLATTSLGAIWSSCSPDFGIQGVLDRFSQIEPKILFTADYYLQRTLNISMLDKIPAIQKGLTSLEATIILSYDGVSQNRLAKTFHIHDLQSRFNPQEIEFERFPFNIPLYIMFSSGTTGIPKCIVHGAGGTLIQHLKEHQLHCNIHPNDRVFYYTTCGWMMWNWLVSALASNATLLLYDGSPFHQKLNILFDYAAAEKMTLFGASAKYIDALKKIKLSPKDTHDLSSLKTMTSTGSPLMAESFDYVYHHIKPDIHLASISGGTDIISCFILGNPNAPVHRGEIQAKGLGMAVDILDMDGKPSVFEKGELVCHRPFPSRPLCFWKDDHGVKYHQAYFDRFQNIWCHGDFAALTPQQGMIIYGRSDSVLNPGGVRIGTAEIYRPVENIDDVVECLAIGHERNNDVRVILFVKLAEGIILTPDLKDKIKQEIRQHASPAHVPAEILQVFDIPRTKSGKIVELAVREIIHGRPIKNIEALANPEALEFFATIKL